MRRLDATPSLRAIRKGITMRCFVLVLSIVLLIAPSASVARAGDGSGGQAGAFLRVPVGSRPVGLGGAYVAIADDASAIHYNPAGLAEVVRFSAEASYSLASMDRSSFHGGIVFGSGQSGGIGIQASGLHIGDIEGRDEMGNPTGTFEDTEIALRIGYARRLGRIVSLGASASYVSHELDTSSASGFAFGAGAMGTFVIDEGVLQNIRFGASAMQLGGTMEWNTESEHRDDLPATYRLGSAVDLRMGEDTPLLLTAQAVMTENEDVKAQFGAELTLAQSLSIRCGWDGDRASFGAGLRVGSIRFDYAFSDDVLEEGPTHWAGLTYSVDMASAQAASRTRNNQSP